MFITARESRRQYTSSVYAISATASYISNRSAVFDSFDFSDVPIVTDWMCSSN